MKVYEVNGCLNHYRLLGEAATTDEARKLVPPRLDRKRSFVRYEVHNGREREIIATGEVH